MKAHREQVRNFVPMFLADWEEVLFMHFAVPPDVLQPEVPFELDLFRGSAYVSVVAFTQRRMRLGFGGRLGAALVASLADHEFCNLRTYVRCGDGTPAIHFVAEWIPNALAAWVGPRTYGLSYRLAQVRYGADGGSARQGAAAFEYRVEHELKPPPLTVAEPGTPDHFLLERYTALTHRRRVGRRFEVSHEPWSQRAARVRIVQSSLLRAAVGWWRHAQFVGANYSPGVREVGISAPRWHRARQLL
jgi:uncharacterized protein